jgi:transcriptional regulator with XRE-family HTH domain
MATQGEIRSLREAIANSGLTTAQIVARVGCTRKSLTNWRNGRRPNDFYISRLSEVLGVDLWPLLGTLHTRRQSSPSPASQRYELPTVGGLTVNWCVIALDHFASPQISCSYNRTPVALAPDIE